MLLRELTGGDPPHVCKLIFIDDPTGFGHRVMNGDRVAEHIDGWSDKVLDYVARYEATARDGG